MPRALLVLLPTLVVACAGHSEGAADAPTLACTFAWRDDVTLPVQSEEPVRLAGPRGERAWRIGELDVQVVHELAGAEPGLRVTVREGERPLLIDHWPLPGGLPDNHPDAGHGFTGLAYVTPSDGSGELQYWCSVTRPDGPRGEEVGRPGKPAPAGSRVVCDFAAGEARQTIDLADPSIPTGGNDSRVGELRIGPFTAAVQHTPGSFDSGAVIVDVTAEGAGKLHALYQLDRRDLPANFTAVSAGFTGVRTLIAPAAQLRFTCRSVSG